jgi:hypothetical protein
MYYRVAIRRERDQRARPPSWQWQSTVLSSLQTVFQFLRLYRARQDHLRVFSSSSRKDLEEQFVQENQGLGSSSVTAAQFLQQRMMRSPEVRWATSERGAQGHQERASIAVSTKAWWDESSKAAHALAEGDISSLERRRLELELGPGGDHDVAYSFALPVSLPQVLAWMRLLARVHRGELEP